MPVQSYDSPNEGKKPTQGVGNAGGRPILPILLGVAAVIVLIVVTILLPKEPKGVPNSRSSNQQIAQDSPPDVSNTATGSGASNSRVLPPGPAVAPITPRGNGTGSRPEADINRTTPEEVGNGRNIVAPPGPAANNVPSGRQGANP